MTAHEVFPRAEFDRRLDAVGAALRARNLDGQGGCEVLTSRTPETLIVR